VIVDVIAIVPWLAAGRPEGGRMLRRLTLLASAVVICSSVDAFAQQQTGEIFGRVTDNSGAVLPGVTVNVQGPALIQPRVVVTSETGTYRVPEIPIGAYRVGFELPGFRTMVLEEIRVTIGFRAQVDTTLQLSSVEETVTVTGESPLIDTRETGVSTTFDLELMQTLPSARDPWVMLERTPGITMDRVNVGGNQSGQQSGYISRGASSGNNKWSIDGVDITDMSATGASPIYYDFDMLQEMQVTTGGADVTQQTGGVGINLVTRSGTDRFNGSGRVYITDEELQDDNITDELRQQGAGSGAPIQNIQDYGFEVGGPIKRGRAWYWGSYGTQDIKVGVVGFYKDTPSCRPGGESLDPLTTPTDVLRGCLETDLTTLNNYNWKVTVVPFANNRFNFQNTWAEKVRSARDASDTRPIETTYRQKAVSSDFGTAGWITGPSPFWKMADQHVLSDRWLVDVMWSHLGNNFTLDFHDDALRDVQPTLETSTGLWGRSYQASIFLRPTNSVDVGTNYFLPGALGGDHAFKIGYRWRSAHSTSLNHRGGFIVARYSRGEPDSADIYRDGNAVSHLDTQAFYVQDTITRNRLTLNLGLRVDRQDDASVAAEVPANPFFPALMPSISYRGADAGVVWTDVSPRIGVTYDLRGDRRNILSSSYSVYYGQMGPGELSGQLAATGAVFVRYPWDDLNRDGFVQSHEVDTGVPFLSKSTAYDPDDPTSTTSPTTVDPDVQNDRTREFIVGFDRQLGSTMAVGANYIWRKYDRFRWNDRFVTDAAGGFVRDFGSGDYRAVAFTPTTCPAGARCEAVTYFEPTRQIPSANVYTNVPDRFRNFNGVEVTFQRRYAERWQMNASLAFNDARDFWDSGNAYEDPTNIAQQHDAQYAPESGGSGIGGIFTNARWLMKLSGRYTFPWDINVAGFYNGRQGYPFPQNVQTPNRANGAGRASVLLDRLGDVRLDNLHMIDFRLDKVFRFGSRSVTPTFEIFNLTNTNTVLAINRNQAASNANTISGIVAPRVIRLGLQVRF
jgi:hypothetical protein